MVLARETAADPTNALFFAGRPVVPEESVRTRFLRNRTAFPARKKLGFAGLPMIGLPVRAL